MRHRIHIECSLVDAATEPARRDDTGRAVVTDEPDLGDFAPPPPPPPPEVSWQARVLCAVQALEAIDQPATPTRLKEMVGAKFASTFLPGDRLYEGARPSWETRVDDATARTRHQKAAPPPEGQGRHQVDRRSSRCRPPPRGASGSKLACAVGEQVAEDTTPTADRGHVHGPSVMARGCRRCTAARQVASRRRASSSRRRPVNCRRRSDASARRAEWRPTHPSR